MNLADLTKKLFSHSKIARKIAYLSLTGLTLFGGYGCSPSKVPPEAKDWIQSFTDERGNKPTGVEHHKTLQIDMKKATGDEVDFNRFCLEYKERRDSPNIALVGFYQGSRFNHFDFYRNSAGEAIATMWLTDKINPKDNQLEGFGFLREEDSDIVAYVFVDEDWRERSRGKINIVWGAKKENLKSRRFNFSNSVRGVYIDRIPNVSWFFDVNPYEKGLPQKGKIFVGEISLDEINKSRLYEDLEGCDKIRSNFFVLY